MNVSGVVSKAQTLQRCTDDFSRSIYLLKDTHSGQYGDNKSDKKIEDIVPCWVAVNASSSVERLCDTYHPEVLNWYCVATTTNAFLGLLLTLKR